MQWQRGSFGDLLITQAEVAKRLCRKASRNLLTYHQSCKHFVQVEYPLLLEYLKMQIHLTFTLDCYC